MISLMWKIMIEVADWQFGIVGDQFDNSDDWFDC